MPAVNATFNAFGLIGVHLPDLRFIKGRTRGSPDYRTKPGCWPGLVFRLAPGRFTARAGGANEVKAARAYRCGAAELPSGLISPEPDGEKEAARGAQEFSLRASAPGRATVTAADLAPMTGGRG